MVYDSRIDFTLDTICPWTYLAKKRLDRALSTFRTANPTAPASFTVHYSPYLLYPNFPSTANKREWYQRERYHQAPDQMAKYEAVMQNLGTPEGIKFSFEGEIAGTLNAHRVVQIVQKRHGVEVAGRLIDGLYRRYFEEGRHPSSEETLAGACVEAGVGEEEAKAVVGDVELEREEVEELVKERKLDGVDSVPYIVVEGRRRDFTLEGAKTVEEYVKVLEQVVKESS